MSINAGIYSDKYFHNLAINYILVEYPNVPATTEKYCFNLNTIYSYNTKT